jgi:microcystin-dependent protein
MRIFTITALLLLSSIFMGLAQVGFNNPTPDPSSLLDLTSYDKGVLVPRMNSFQRKNIPNAANGLMVFDTDLQAYCVYDATTTPKRWMMVNPWKTTDTTLSTSNVVLTTTGNVGIGTTSPTAKLEVNGTFKAGNTTVGTISGTTATYTGNVTGNKFVGDGTVPCGTVVMWYGNVNAIPAGWVLCDGTNSTPDLRGRFVVGYDDRATNPNNQIWDTAYHKTIGGKPNGIGGEVKHTLTIAELPKHQHTVGSGDGATISDGSHSHYLSTRSIGTSGTTTTIDEIQGIGSYNGYDTYSSTHTHTGTTGNGTTGGLNNQPHENRPPFKVMVYIMRNGNCSGDVIIIDPQ